MASQQHREASILLMRCLSGSPGSGPGERDVTVSRRGQRSAGVPRCRAVGKDSYETRAEALAHPGAQHAYECEACHKWHRTSRKPDDLTAFLDGASAPGSGSRAVSMGPFVGTSALSPEQREALRNFATANEPVPAKKPTTPKKRKR